jgi:uncharacterized protein
MNEDAQALDRFDGTVRLFPLPNLVFFPHSLQGLHIFEPRYRQMMAEAVAGDMTMALALLRPGWEPIYDDRPPLFPVACLGRITQYEKLPDGRYNLRLKGLSRVLIKHELQQDTLFRSAAAELLADRITIGPAELVAHRQRLADAVLPRFPADGSARLHLEELFAGDTPLGPLTDMLAYALPLPTEFKQQLLEEAAVDLRAEILSSFLKNKSSAADRSFPPAFSPN